MAGHKGTEGFVVELPLVTTRSQERVLNVRLDAARQVYNACLGEARRRLDLMRQSVDYNKARKMPKGRELTKRFRELYQRFELREYDLHAYAKQFNHSWLGDHLDINTIQKLASRAYSAVQQYAYGRRGKPRFKGKRGLHSVEGKSNKQGIRYRGSQIFWLGLVMPCRINPEDEVLAYGLKQPIKYCRLLRREIGSKTRWFVQLVVKGKSYQKAANKPGEHIVGLDIGPSTIAIVDDETAELTNFCSELQNQREVLRRGARKLDRSRRATNPDNYNEDGTVKKGPKRWVRSKRYQQLRRRLADVHRCLSEQRKSLQGCLANQTIRRGKEIRTEKISYRSFQRNYGRSVGFRAPGMFVSMLERKAERAGGRVEMLNTWSLKLSQTCLCGRQEKKKLSQRWHQCECGVSGQRDLFSAYLARHVQGGQLDAASALGNWPSAEQLLSRAASSYQKAARRNGTGRPRLPAGVGQSGSPAEDRIAETKARDVVAVGQPMRESSREAEAVPIRTPWL